MVWARFADMGLVDASHTSMDVPSCRRLYKMRVRLAYAHPQVSHRLDCDDGLACSCT